MNKPRIEIPELSLFLSNGKFKESDIKEFLDLLIQKYKFNYQVINKIIFTFEKLKINIPYHFFFIKKQDNYDRKSFSKAQKIFEFKKNTKELIHLKKKIRQIIILNELFVNNTINSITNHFNINYLSLSQDIRKKTDLSKKISEYNQIDFENFMIHIESIIIKRLLKKNKMQKNQIATSKVFTPFYQSGERAYNEIKLVKNPGKIISINNK